MKAALQYLKQADIIGVIVSGLCIIHCIITPFVVIALGLTSHNHHPLFSWHGLFLICALIALFLSIKGAAKGVKIILWISFICMAVGMIFEHLGGAFKVILYIGSIGLIIGHIKNYLQHHKSH